MRARMPEPRPCPWTGQRNGQAHALHLHRGAEEGYSRAVARILVGVDGLCRVDHHTLVGSFTQIHHGQEEEEEAYGSPFAAVPLRVGSRCLYA